MKKILLTIVLIFGVMFILNSGADALTFPDPTHEPLGQSDTTVPDSTEGSGMLSNLFFVPTGGTTITFDYNFITDENPGDDEFNDYFAVALFDTAQNPLIFSVVTDVVSSTFFDLDPSANGPHGSVFSYETGVLGDSLVIGSEYEDTWVMLGFAVFDVGDHVVDSGVLIDNISSLVPYGDFENGLIGEIVAPSVFENGPEGIGFIQDEGEGSYMYGGNIHLLPDEGVLDGVDTAGFTGNYAYMSTGPEDMPPVVPEPISSTLFLIGGATLGFRRFRKSKVQ